MLCEPTIRLCFCTCFLLMQHQGLLELSWRSLHCRKQIQALAKPLQRQCKVVQKGSTTIKYAQASHFPLFPPIFFHFPPFSPIPLIFPIYSIFPWLAGYWDTPDMDTSQASYTRTVHADVLGRGKGPMESRIMVRDQGIPDNEGIGGCCAPKQIKGLDCLGPWGKVLRTMRSCRNPLKVKNAILQAPGNLQNNALTSGNLAVQRTNCPVVNITRVRNFPRDFLATVQNNPGAKFSRAKNSRCENPPPPLVGWGMGNLHILQGAF